MCANITNSINNKIKVVNTESLNFRKGPSTEYEIIQQNYYSNAFVNGRRRLK